MGQVFPGLRPAVIPPMPRFIEQWFRDQRYGMGHDCRWEQSRRCECKTIYPSLNEDPGYQVSSRAGVVKCPECDGTRIALSPAQAITLLVTQTSQDPKLLEVYGDLMTGSCGFTFAPEQLPKPLDRVTDMDAVRAYTETLTRTGAEDQPTYPIVVETIAVGSGSDDTVRALAERSVRIIRYADSAGNSRAECVEGVDFTLEPDGSGGYLVAWSLVSDNVPAVGDSYDIDYVCRPVYTVRRVPHLDRTTQVDAAATTPINPVDGYQGEWDASAGTFPGSPGVSVGDYFEVTVAGTVDGVAFVVGDVLVALVLAPSTTVYAANWQRMGDESPTIIVQHMPVFTMCWLEDLGDPFDRPGLP